MAELTQGRWGRGGALEGAADTPRLQGPQGPPRGSVAGALTQAHTRALLGLKCSSTPGRGPGIFCESGEVTVSDSPASGPASAVGVGLLPLDQDLKTVQRSDLTPSRKGQTLHLGCHPAQPAPRGLEAPLLLTGGHPDGPCAPRRSASSGEPSGETAERTVSQHCFFPASPATSPVRGFL